MVSPNAVSQAERFGGHPMRSNWLSLTARSCGSGIFDPVLVVIAFGWQELRNLINAVGTAATEGSGRKADRLTDFEFVLEPSLRTTPLRGNRATLIVGFTRNITTTKLPRWAISKACISWFMALRVLAKRCARSGPNH